MPCIEMSVGRLMCRPLRSYLDACKFKGWNIDYLESSGFLEREFTIRGEAADMEKVNRDLDQWVSQMNKTRPQSKGGG